MGSDSGTGTVLTAAGMSRRMKAFKPLLPLGGSTIIRTCVETYVNAHCSPVIVVTGNNAGLIEEQLSGLPVEFVFNPEYETSDMFTSVRLGLAAAEGRCGRLFISPADIPLIKQETLQKLLGSHADMVRPVCAGAAGHPILVSSELIPEIMSYNGEGGLKGALEHICAGKGRLMLETEVGDPGILLDADTPEDYEPLIRYFENEKDTQF